MRTAICDEYEIDFLFLLLVTAQPLLPLSAKQEASAFLAQAAWNQRNSTKPYR